MYATFSRYNNFMKEKILKFISSKKFKRIFFYTGIFFILVSFFFAFNPKPLEKLGYFGVFLFSIFGAGSIIVAALARHLNIFALTLAAALGIGVLDTFQWLTGKSGIAVIEPSKKILRIEKLIQKYGWPILFCMAIIPWPYDFVSVLAGYLGFSYKKFIVPTLIGNYFRVLLISLIILYFLPK